MGKGTPRLSLLPRLQVVQGTNHAVCVEGLLGGPGTCPRVGPSMQSGHRWGMPCPHTLSSLRFRHPQHAGGRPDIRAVQLLGRPRHSPRPGHQCVPSGKAVLSFDLHAHGGPPCRASVPKGTRNWVSRSFASWDPAPCSSAVHPFISPPHGGPSNDPFRLGNDADVEGNMLIFDEAHNMEDVAREAASIQLGVQELAEVRLACMSACWGCAGVRREGKGVGVVAGVGVSGEKGRGSAVRTESERTWSAAPRSQTRAPSRQTRMAFDRAATSNGKPEVYKPLEEVCERMLNWMGAREQDLDQASAGVGFPPALVFSLGGARGEANGGGSSVARPCGAGPCPRSPPCPTPPVAGPGRHPGAEAKPV